ncbi:MAG: nucleotidyl transferase AbiEii/AbiGii toxin family protein [Acidobacteriaceae bacterium]|nr:nucleotidyl transferase AbiEii/AbiGii toxin family protein [Acidobacteriaceae bacterium]
MYQDYKDLLSAFQSHGVKYLVVGGYAVIYHSQPRFTKDIDVFIKADPENANAIYAALSAFGAPLQDIRPEDFTDGNNFFRFGHEPRSFDILPAIPGVEFDAAWDRRVEIEIDRATEFKANFISAEDLIASKLASGRPQDLADVHAIRKAAESARSKPGREQPPEPIQGSSQ